MAKYIDIGANLVDNMFLGIYNNSKKHEPDLDMVISRAKERHVEYMLVTGSCLTESRKVVDLCKQYKNYLFATVGVHPCSAASVPTDDLERQKYYNDLIELASSPEVKAFGEIGLDYDRLHYASKSCQLSVFRDMLAIAVKLKLPLFLHSRNASLDFYNKVSELALNKEIKGVVHSFTGSLEELQGLLKLGFYIGLNGCSFKTEENIEVAKHVPLNKLMLETDSPWCEIRPSHPSFVYTEKLPYEYANKPAKHKPGQMVKGRCEPCSMENVARVYAGITETDLQDVIDAAYRNSMDLFEFDK